MSAHSVNQLPLAPLGAGDLIDRAVRLYRRHLIVLIRTAAPPVMLTAAGWIRFGSTPKIFISVDNDELFRALLLSILAAMIMFAGFVFMIVVMGTPAL